MTLVDQVLGRLLSAFKEMFPTMYTITDGSLVFIKTSSDIHMKSSIWNQYKYHYTVKFGVHIYTPNRAIYYIYPVYAGSIQIKKLPHVCDFLTTLQDKPGVSAMADRGVTINSVLKDLVLN